MKLQRFILITLLIVFIHFVATAQTRAVDGKAIFESKCTRCHGSNGTKGAFGAKNLRKSTLNDEKLINVISNGRWIMPRWKNELSPEQIQAVITYIKTLRG